MLHSLRAQEKECRTSLPSRASTSKTAPAWTSVRWTASTKGRTCSTSIPTSASTAARASRSARSRPSSPKRTRRRSGRTTSRRIVTSSKARIRPENRSAKARNSELGQEGVQGVVHRLRLFQRRQVPCSRDDRELRAGNSASHFLHSFGRRDRIVVARNHQNRNPNLPE